mmetsp:Transcript_74760/g.177861  ORF Transcript_74760/g.177861 Transcript_74760/m.177861 type:complete len:220 (-) Transcript_74760:440-1099(-)
MAFQQQVPHFSHVFLRCTEALLKRTYQGAVDTAEASVCLVGLLALSCNVIQTVREVLDSFPENRELLIHFSSGLCSSMCHFVSQRVDQRLLSALQAIGQTRRALKLPIHLDAEVRQRRGQVLDLRSHALLQRSNRMVCDLKLCRGWTSLAEIRSDLLQGLFYLQLQALHVHLNSFLLLLELTHLDVKPNASLQSSSFPELLLNLVHTAQDLFLLCVNAA